jgi:hypothetical protein
VLHREQLPVRQACLHLVGDQRALLIAQLALHFTAAGKITLNPPSPCGLEMIAATRAGSISVSNVGHGALQSSSFVRSLGKGTW